MEYTISNRSFEPTGPDCCLFTETTLGFQSRCRAGSATKGHTVLASAAMWIESRTCILRLPVSINPEANSREYNCAHGLERPGGCKLDEDVCPSCARRKP